MKSIPILVAASILGACGTQVTKAASLLTNGNLDLTQAVEIVPGFFLPKPSNWENVGTRAISGPYEDEMSSEPWAGPAPTPVTTDGNANPPPPEGCGGPDCGVFFKPFSGNAINGAATGSLYQDVPGTPGQKYTLTGWAGAEANALMQNAVFAIEFLDAGNTVIDGTTLSLLPSLFTPNGQPFNYKQYSLDDIAPAGTVKVRSRVSMIGALGNPDGGGQAFVVDDFELIAGESVPDQLPAAFVAPVVAALFGAQRWLGRNS
jgi:hypothetical protein